MEIKTKFNLGNEVYVLRPYFTTYSDNEMWEVAAYGRKCTVTGIFTETCDGKTDIMYKLHSNIYIFDEDFKEEWLFMDLEEAKEECRRRNNEEDYGYHY